jgi:hypothetical protein
MRRGVKHAQKRAQKRVSLNCAIISRSRATTYQMRLPPTAGAKRVSLVSPTRFATRFASRGRQGQQFELGHREVLAIAGQQRTAVRQSCGGDSDVAVRESLALLPPIPA